MNKLSYFARINLIIFSMQLKNYLQGSVTVFTSIYLLNAKFLRT
ncbi:hypothetical protein SAMN05444146_5204 [Flavobacterium johnsoniae]|nr:hypothetical protein SAMN05444146_5204 [Flavobacterium johnsoniae]